jgi:hypothetical protein
LGGGREREREREREEIEGVYWERYSITGPRALELLFLSQLRLARTLLGESALPFTNYAATVNAWRWMRLMGGGGCASHLHHAPSKLTSMYVC